MKISILKSNIDKLGTIGLFITALFSPCCFPLFAFGASALGLGSIEPVSYTHLDVYKRQILLSALKFSSNSFWTEIILL